MKRNAPLQRKTPLRSYTSLKSKTPLRSTGTLKRKSSSPKKKQPSISTLKKKLWEVFSKYIRARDNYTCFTCGRKGEGSGIHAGHYINKSVGGLGLYFEETNVHAQCYHDNINLGGNGAIYHMRMVDKYGIDHVNELWRRKEQDYTKWTVENYLEKIEHYTQKLHETQLQAND